MKNEAYQIQNIEGLKFNVVDTRFNKVVKRNLNGAKARAYAEFCNQELAKAESQWATWDAQA